MPRRTGDRPVQVATAALTAALVTVACALATPSVAVAHARPAPPVVTLTDDLIDEAPAVAYALSAEGGSVPTTQPLATASAGSHTLILVRATVPGAASARVPAAKELVDAWTTAAGWWAQISSGRISIKVPAVAEVQDMYVDHDLCRSVTEQAEFLSSAKQQVASRVGQTSASPGTHVVLEVASGTGPACVGRVAFGSLGKGAADGGTILLLGTTAPSVLTHEFGHNLGLMHGNELACSRGGQQVTDADLPAECHSVEYAGYFTPMGGVTFSAPLMLSPSQTAWLGWSEAFTHTTVSAPTLVTLTPAGLRAPGRYAHLVIGSDEYWLEYRRKVGADAGLGTWPLPEGVILTRNNPTHQGHPWRFSDLLDANLADGDQSGAAPDSGTFDGNPVLRPGVWTVLASGAALRVASLTSGMATVVVTPSLADVAGTADVTAADAPHPTRTVHPVSYRDEFDLATTVPPAGTTRGVVLTNRTRTVTLPSDGSVRHVRGLGFATTWTVTLRSCLTGTSLCRSLALPPLTTPARPLRAAVSVRAGRVALSLAAWTARASGAVVSWCTGRCDPLTSRGRWATRVLPRGTRSVAVDPMSGGAAVRGVPVVARRGAAPGGSRVFSIAVLTVSASGNVLSVRTWLRV